MRSKKNNENPLEPHKQNNKNFLPLHLILSFLFFYIFLSFIQQNKRLYNKGNYLYIDTFQCSGDLKQEKCGTHSTRKKHSCLMAFGFSSHLTTIFLNFVIYFYCEVKTILWPLIVYIKLFMCFLLARRFLDGG